MASSSYAVDVVERRKLARPMHMPDLSSSCFMKLLALSHVIDSLQSSRFVLPTYLTTRSLILSYLFECLEWIYPVYFHRLYK